MRCSLNFVHNEELNIKIQTTNTKHQKPKTKVLMTLTTDNMVVNTQGPSDCGKRTLLWLLAHRHRQQRAHRRGEHVDYFKEDLDSGVWKDGVYSGQMFFNGRPHDTRVVDQWVRQKVGFVSSSKYVRWTRSNTVLP